MKYTIMTLLMALATYSQAAVIEGGRANEVDGTLELDVAYGGGCEEHRFDLQVDMCLESHPVKCDAKLIHDSNGDACEAYISRTVEFSLSELGLNDAYFSRGSLTINGDGGTKVTVILPNFN